MCSSRSVPQCSVVSSGEYVRELYRGESSAYWNISSAGILPTTTAERILTQHPTCVSARHNMSLSGTHTHFSRFIRRVDQGFENWGPRKFLRNKIKQKL